MIAGLAARRGRFAFVFAAGIASSFGFAPWNLWPLTIAGVLLLIAFAHASGSPKGALAGGWWFGFGHFLLGTHWIAQAFEYQSNLPVWTGWAGVLLLSAYLAVFPALAAAGARLFSVRRPAFAFAFAALWLLTEWLRGWLFSGFPWNPLGAAALPVPGLGQAAAIVGATGVSALVCLFAGGLWLLAARRWRPGLVLSGAVVASGLGGLSAALTPVVLTPARVHIVQADIGQDEKWSRGGVELAVAKYLALSPPPTGSPRLLIWPEAAVPDLLDEMPALRRRLGAALGEGDLMLIGALKAIRRPDGRAIAARNSLFVLDSDGAILARYDKKRLVPFGEFLPFRGVLEAVGLARLAPGTLDFWPGPGPRTLALPGFAPVGPLICYEVIFAGSTVDRGNRPRWLLNVSNDAWFAGAGAAMHLAQARLRSIEQGLPMARATPTGISAVIDPRGRVLRSLRRGEAGVIDVRLPAPLPPTIFGRAGDVAFLLLALVLAGAARLTDRHR